MNAHTKFDFDAVKKSVVLSDVISRVVKLKRTGAEQVGCCPFHPDKTPSFSVNDEKGVFLCRGCKATGDVFDFVMRDQNVTLNEAARIIGGNKAAAPKPAPTPPTIYTYQNADGSTAFRVHRNAKKGFPCSRPNGNGGWEWEKPDVVVPYRLPELIAADHDQPVFIVEGEKDADNLAALGCVATTNPFGGGNWLAEFGRHLAGRDVVILEDNDEQGRKHVIDVAAKLKGIARSIATVTFRDLPEKSDVSDWLAADPTRNISHLVELVGSTAEKPVVPSKFGSLTASALDLIKFAPLRYVIPGLLPEGLAILAGKPKFGKSFAALDIGIAVATGGKAFGSIPCEAGDVLYCALEDGPRRLQDRIRGMLPLGDDMPKRLFIETVANRLDGGLIDDLKGWLFHHPDARLIVLDTLARIKPESSGKATLYDEDARGLTPLHELTRDHPGVAFVIIHHTRKMEADDCFDTISGSTGLTGIFDTLMVLARQGEGAKLSGQGRDIDGYEKALTRNALTGSWCVVGDAREMAKTGERQAILDEMTEADMPLTPTQIAGAIGKKRDNVQHLLKRLQAEGLVKKEGYGKWSLSNPRSLCSLRSLSDPDHRDDYDDSEQSEQSERGYK